MSRGTLPGRSLLTIPLCLEREQFGILAASRDQLVMGSVFDYRPLLEDDYSICHSDCRKPVRDDHGHAPSDQAREPDKYLVLGARVQGRGGLVQYKNLSVAHISPGQGDFLP